MLQEVSYIPILGKPLILWLGLLTLCSFLVTASIPLIRNHGKIRVSVLWHRRLAGISIALGLAHGILGLLTYV